ncbi:MAG: hypothetical protein JKY66_01735 [Spongiibacteraceae bacterium]|nr:hypothetical protein [Spongiibacteraceae bacterium]
MMKPGTKLKSCVCNTEVMVIKGCDLAVDCGGVALSVDSQAEKITMDKAFNQGTQIGKRYVNEEGTIELLCVKAGEGSLSIDGKALQLKDAKPLPSSD